MFIWKSSVKQTAEVTQKHTASFRDGGKVHNGRHYCMENKIWCIFSQSKYTLAIKQKHREFCPTTVSNMVIVHSGINWLLCATPSIYAINWASQAKLRILLFGRATKCFVENQKCNVWYNTIHLSCYSSCWINLCCLGNKCRQCLWGFFKLPLSCFHSFTEKPQKAQSLYVAN